MQPTTTELPRIQRINENSSHEYEVPPGAFDSLPIGAGKMYANLAHARWSFRDMCANGLGHNPIHADEGADGMTYVIVRPGQTADFASISHEFAIAASDTVDETRASVKTVLDRKLRLRWGNDHYFDFYQSELGGITGVLTINKPKGSQTMRVDLPKEITVENLEQAWKEKDDWRSGGSPDDRVKSQGIYHHVRYIPLPGEKFIVWIVNHNQDRPNDRCFVANRVPTMEEVFGKKLESQAVAE